MVFTLRCMLIDDYFQKRKSLLLLPKNFTFFVSSRAMQIPVIVVGVGGAAAAELPELGPVDGASSMDFLGAFRF